MAVHCFSSDRTLRAELSGELDHHAAKEIMGELERQIELNLPRRLTIDMGGVTFMDSSGIAVLLRAWKHMGRLEGSVTVSNVPKQAGRVLQAAGLHRMMQIQ